MSMGPMLSTPLAFFGLAVPTMACTCCGSIGGRGSSFASRMALSYALMILLGVVAVGRPNGAPGVGRV
eukprot:530630-Pyramimonas_sp.AAC.1